MAPHCLGSCPAPGPAVACCPNATLVRVGSGNPWHSHGVLLQSDGAAAACAHVLAALERPAPGSGSTPVMDRERVPSPALASIAATNTVVVVVTARGEVYEWREPGGEAPEGPGPQLVPALGLGVVAHTVSCGREHVLVASDTGVWAWGGNALGQCGVGIGVGAGAGLAVGAPALVCAGTGPWSVAGGWYHSLAACGATDIPAFWSWGWGLYGQLGHGGNGNEAAPRRVEALDSEVPLGLLGVPPFGPGLQAARGPSATETVGVVVEGDKGAAGWARPRVGAGAWHSVFLSGLGDVYTCGWGKHGQLGHSVYCDGSDSDSHDSEEQAGANPDSGGGGGSGGVGAGGVATGGHPASVRVPDAGHVSTPPVDPHGFLGLLPDGCRKDVPVLVEALADLTVASVHAGAKHSVAVTEEGRVYAWGALCVPGSSGGSVAPCVATPTLCPLPGRCLQLLCGHHHTVALVE